MMRTISAIVVVLSAIALSATCDAQEHQTVYVNVGWTMPDGHSDWEPWMAGETITVKCTAATSNGQYTYYGYGTIDYETATVSCVLDVTGLPESHYYILGVEVPLQYISGGPGKVASISSLTDWGWFSIGDYTPKTLNVGLLKVNGTL